VTVIDRRAARVLLLDSEDRVLLLHGIDPGRAGTFWWFTPGGGLDEGETHAQGAARELFEEIGLRVDPAALGEPVHAEVARFSYDNRDYRQDQLFFVHRVTSWEVDTAGMDDEERATISETRWWSAEEIEASDELIYPEELAALVRRCATDGGGR
jgi:8-oxo-dGTP pyrophosphatase MutT (NUDIX family)